MLPDDVINTDKLTQYLREFEDRITSKIKRETLEATFPVGSIYHSYSVSTSPAAVLGFGTWTAIAGRVLVGIDAGQTEFDTINETGGAKTHTLTIAEIPSHNHGNGRRYHTPDVNDGTAAASGAAAWGAQQLANTGGGGSHNNLQPYIVVYMWYRSA